MAEKREFRAIKGTRDILPPDSALWNWFEQTAREVFETYGFRNIRVPIFEETSLFARSIGAETDIVSKEMFTFSVQEVPDLLNLWNIVTTWSDPWSEGGQFASYRNIAHQFVVMSRQAFAQGLVATDEFNRKVLKDLESHEADLWSAAFLHAEGFVRRMQTTARLLELGQPVTLRPEGTASVCRAYIENGMQTLPGNQKLYYMGPMFRRERPQKGRYRQFYQIGAEVLGQSDAPGIDAEVIEMLLVFFKRARLKNIKLQVNSIGHNDEECRGKYVKLLREKLQEVRGRLGPDSQRRIETNPLRVLDSKLPNEQEIIESLPHISDHLCSACLLHFAELKEELNLREVDYEENWRLVRGLDYYTRTTFEVTAEGLGSQNAVCGGGRYDGLVKLLGGPPTKGIGFAIGTDRAILSIQEGADLPHLPGLGVFVVQMGFNPGVRKAVVRIAGQLRSAGIAVEVPPGMMRLGKALDLADRLGAKYALILGEDEVASQTFTLKQLSSGEQKKMNENDLLEYLESERRGSRA